MNFSKQSAIEKLEHEFEETKEHTKDFDQQDEDNFKVDRNNTEPLYLQNVQQINILEDEQESEEEEGENEPSPSNIIRNAMMFSRNSLVLRGKATTQKSKTLEQHKGMIL